MSYFRLTLLFLLFSIPSFSFAQGPTGSVSGKLIDGKNAPVAYATVTLLRADSSVAGGDLSKDDGAFRISPVAAGSYTLKIESIGSIAKRLTVQVDEGSDKKMGAIKVDAGENALKTVNITGEKPIMELKVDKKVFNVEKNTTTAGGSATDVLQNVPAVSVDADGSINLRGKGNVTVLIDGKPATLLGPDVTSALQSLPAGSIESVEVITNPSAKYDAQGTTGIINIITKKENKLGMNGTLTLGAGTGDKYNGGLTFNVRKGRWNAFLNSNIRINNTWNNVSTHRQDVESPFHSYYTYEHVPRIFNGAFNTFGFTYDFDKNNSLTLTENVNLMQFGFKDYSTYSIYSQPNETGSPYQTTDRYSDAHGGPLSLSSAVDYKHKFQKKDEELSVDATFAAMSVHREQYFRTITGVDTTVQNAPGNGTNNSLNVWADYTDPLFTKNGKLGLGFKSQFYTFNSSNTPTIKVNGGPETTDYSLLSTYNYTQQIHAAYANWNDQLGKFSYQVGLRYEDAIYDGTGNVPAASVFHNSFSNFFPSAFVSYQLPDQQSIYLTYSRRTNRPNFFQMMPFKDFSNPGTVSMGNPNIEPEFINNIEFSYNKQDKKGNNIILSAYYTRTDNLIERVSRLINPADSVLGLGNQVGNLLSIPVNIASGTTFGLEGTAHLQLTSLWDATLSANYFHNSLVIGNDSLVKQVSLTNNSGDSWFAKINTNLKLPANFSLQVNGNYESPKVIAQGSMKESYWIDVALRKNLWRNKATLVINCSDIFKTRQFITYYNSPFYTETIDRVKQTRIGNINFTWRFGKSDFGKDIAKGKGGKSDKGALKPVAPTDQDRENNLKQKDDDNGGGGGGMQSGGGGQRKQG
jgi:iron complex outermembrane receptor protein